MPAGQLQLLQTPPLTASGLETSRPFRALLAAHRCQEPALRRQHPLGARGRQRGGVFGTGGCSSEGRTGLPSGPGEQRGEAEQHREMPQHYPLVASPGGSLAEK